MELDYKMFQKRGQIFVRDTDATGHVFCPRPIEWVIEAFEEACFLAAKKKSVQAAIAQAHVQFFHPFAWGDVYQLCLEVTRVGNRSLEITGKILKEEQVAIVVQLTFVLEGSAQEFLDQYWGK